MKREVGRVFVKAIFEKQNRIKNQVEHLWWSFLKKLIEKLFLQKVSSQMFDWVLNTPLKRLKLSRSN